MLLSIVLGGIAIGALIAIICASLLLIILLVVVILWMLKHHKSGTLKVDEAFIEKLRTNLGGRENIKSVSFKNGRVNFILNDIYLADLKALKEMSTTGVFVTDDTVKMLFSYDSDTICKAVLR